MALKNLELHSQTANLAAKRTNLIGLDPDQVLVAGLGLDHDQALVAGLGLDHDRALIGLVQAVLTQQITGLDPVLATADLVQEQDLPGPTHLRL